MSDSVDPDPDSDVDTEDPGPVDGDGDGAFASVDCDDTDVHPGAPERCNGVDDDCDEIIDEEPVDPSDWYGDHDEDGFAGGAPVTACEAPDGFVATSEDCDDTDATIHPDRLEIPGDGIDNDCADGDARLLLYVADRWGFVSGLGATWGCTVAWPVDVDGDGFLSIVQGGLDCDDTEASIHPDADEVLDGVDSNCDGLDGLDRDGDGAVAREQGGDDCDDEHPGVYPGVEACFDRMLRTCREVQEASRGARTGRQKDGSWGTHIYGFRLVLWAHGFATANVGNIRGPRTSPGPAFDWVSTRLDEEGTSFFAADTSYRPARLSYLCSHGFRFAHPAQARSCEANGNLSNVSGALYVR